MIIGAVVATRIERLPRILRIWGSIPVPSTSEFFQNFKILENLSCASRRSLMAGNHLKNYYGRACVQRGHIESFKKGHPLITAATNVRAKSYTSVYSMAWRNEAMASDYIDRTVDKGVLELSQK